MWYNQNGKPMNYVQLRKALYRTLQATLLFWRLLTSTPQEWGFKINEYNQCIVNKLLYGKQCTINWHIDDLKYRMQKKR